MARRIRWQIVVAVVGSLVVVALLTQLAISTAARVDPLPGGSYTEAIISPPQQLIPLLNDPLNDPGGRAIGSLLFDGLTRIGLDGLPEGALATRWEVDNSGEVYLFTLRSDVTWHDGTPFSADDVLFTIRTIQNNQIGDAAQQALWQSVLVDRIDDTTVRFTLDAPYAPFVTAARVPILPAHLLGDVDPADWADSDFARQPVGTGPYQMGEWDDTRLTLQANPDYFGGRPFMDTIAFRPIETPQVAFSQLAGNEIQAFGVGAAVAPEIGQVSLPPATQRLTLPLDEYVILTFNLREAPLDSQAFRQTLARGLDKSTLIEQVYGGQLVPVATPILPGWWAYDPAVSWYAPNPVLAAQELNDLGYQMNADGVLERQGEPLTLPLITDGDPGRLAAAGEIVRQWGELGIVVELEQLEPAELRERLHERDFLLALHGWARLGPDPDPFGLWHSSQAEAGLNYAGLRDDAIDAMLTSGRVNQEIAVRSEDYADFQRRWIELAPSITLYQPLYTFVTDETVGGIGFSQQEILTNRLMLFGREDRYRNITGWFVNSAREIRGNLR